MSVAGPFRRARTFVRIVVEDTFADFLTLIEGEQASASYKKVEDAVRRTTGIQAHDLLKLEEATVDAVPDPYRSTVRAAMGTLSNAYTDELVVREHAAYFVGLAVGQMFPDVRFDSIREEPPA